MKKLILYAMVFILSGVSYGQARKSKYYIEGDYEAKAVNGEFKYELSNIVYKGVTSMSDNFLTSTTTQDGSVVFTFKGAKTGYPAQFSNVRFWKWQNSKWQIDSETKKGTPRFQSTKEMSMVLVLDYSQSIGTDFNKLKESAIKFIENIYAKSSNGNVKIGIVLFNTMDNTDKMVFPVKGLDSNSKSDMIRFIRSSNIKKNTALYYAMKKGVAMLEEHNGNINSENYDGSYLITFTDGIDNQSMDAKLGTPTIGKDDPYFQHVKNLISNTKIKGKNIESHIIAVQGNDVGDNSLFKSILEDLSTNFILAENFDQVNATFSKIANDLIDKWQDLECYVPPRFKGKVRWTLDDGSEYILNTPKSKIIKPTTSGTLNFVLFNSMLSTSPFSIYYSRVNNWGFYAGLGYGSYYIQEYGYEYDYISGQYVEGYQTYYGSALSLYGGVTKRFGSSNFYGNAGGTIYRNKRTDLMLDLAVLYKLKKLAIRSGFGLGTNSTSYFSIGAGFNFN